MRYQNFNASIYCPVGNLLDIHDLEEFAQKFAFFEKHVKVNSGLIRSRFAPN